MSRQYSFDEKCLDLARHFFPDAADGFLRDVAQCVQETIEAVPVDEPTPETRPARCQPLAHIFNVGEPKCECGAVQFGKPSNTPVETPPARCTCNDYPGADQFCTAHKAPETSALPDHLKAEAPPLGQCDACERKTWDRRGTGKECGMRQPDGSVCHGRLIAL